MAKTRDGFYKLTASSIGSDLYVLLGGGGQKSLSDFALSSSFDNYYTKTESDNRFYGATISRTANTVLAAPNGSNGVATFRKLVSADIPDLSGTYLPLSGGIMNKEAYISWNASEYGDSVSDWNTVTGHGLRIISSTAQNTNAPKTYSTALHVKGSYGFLIASEGGALANSFFIRNINNSVWNTLLHSNNSLVSGGGSTWGSSLSVTINGTTKTLTIPSNPNSHYTTRIYAGASGTAANAATANPYLKVTDNNTYRNLVRFVGSGFTTVNSDANGNITISSTDTTYNVFGKTINSDFKTAYRTLTKGNTSQGYYIAAIRNDTSSVTDSPTYGSGLAFGMADTHGYLYLNYNAVEAYLGAGNADKLNWVKKLAFADGTGASGTWAISVSGNAATSSRLKILDLRGTNHLPNSSNYPSKHVTGWFNSTGTPNSEWYSGLTIKGWDNTYQTWLIASGSTTAIHERMYYRCGITNSSGTATWNDWKEIAFTSDFSGLFTAFSLSSGTLSATIGGTTKSVTLSISKLGTATVGATGRPIYLNAGTPTPITVSASTSTLYITGVTSSTSDIYTGTLSTSGVRIVGGNKLYAYSGFFESSDERLKDFYEDIDVDLEKLAQLPKKYFKWKDGSKELNIGTSAQELQKIYPELVSQDDQGLLSVAYDKLSIIALKGIDKLYKEMLELKQRINKLENYGNRC